MKVLLLLSLILVVCYSHTRLRTHPLIQPISDQYPYQPDLTTSKDNVQLDFQRAFPAAKETQLHSLHQDFEYLDANLANTTYSTNFENGINAILANAQGRTYLTAANAVRTRFSAIATTLQKQTKRNTVDTYTIQFRLDDGRGTTINGYFTIKDGATTLDSYRYNIMTVTNKAATQSRYTSVNTPLDPSVSGAYDAGVDQIKALLVSNGDVDAGVSLTAQLNSVQLQVTDNTDNSYLFQITLNQNVSVVVTASFTVAIRGGVNYFTDYSYYVQKNQFASVSADPITVLDVSAADSGAVRDVFNAGVSALTDIAISQSDLRQGGVLSKKTITNIQSQRVGVNTNYIFQATLTSNQNSIFAVNLVVAAYYNGTNKLTAFAYNVLTNTSYVTANPGTVTVLNAADASLSPNSDTLQFGVRALLVAAKARNDLPSSFPDSNVTVNGFQSRNVSEGDVTYTFQVSLTDNNGTVVAASISVTIRAGVKLLTAYAYNIVSTTSATVKSASLDTLDTILATNGTIADFLKFGTDKVKDRAVQRGDIDSNTNFVRAVVLKLQRQITGNDLTYIFQANLATNTSIVLAASFSVTLRAYNGEKYLTAYAYSQQVSNSVSVFPFELRKMNESEAFSNAKINDALNFGLSQIVDIAKNNTHLSVNFTIDNSTLKVISLRNQTIGLDYAYYFQVSFGDSINVIFSASFTVTLRYYITANVLSAYAYNIQKSNITSVQAQSPVDVPLTELTNNVAVSSSLTSGLDALTRIAIHKGDLATNDSVTDRNVTSIKRVITGNDVTYIFQVYANTTGGLQLSASLSVTTRPSYENGRIKILTGYAYIIQQANITRVHPVISNLTLAGADRSLIDSGIQQLKQIAQDAGHIPANYSYFVEDIKNFSAVTTGRDITYIFQVYLKGTTNDRDNIYQLQLAATISVTRRAVNTTDYLTAYAYNVLNATITLNAPKDFVSVDVSEQNTTRVQPLLDFGAAFVKNLAQINGDLSNPSRLTAQTVVSIRNQSQYPDYSYSFQVEFTDNQGAGLAATFTVTYRDTDRNISNGYILVNYAYNSLNTTLGSVSTAITGVLSDQAKTDVRVQNLFRAGYDQIIAAAKANSQIPQDTNFTTFNIISGQNVTLGDFSGYQFQANLDDGNGVTIGAAFTVVDMQSFGNAVSNYAYNAQTVRKRQRRST